TIAQAKQNGKLDTAYSSATEPTIPKDLEKALKENELAWNNFAKFSNSTKLQYVYWVNSAKKDETRQKRIMNVVKNAAQNIKPT
ncbi:MAG: YdeI/OmpD-associated family protein, partial [Candidatus Bathyarchaeota archaeon]